MDNILKDYTYRNICTLSDSQAIIKSIDNFHINSKLGFHQSMLKLAEHNRLKLVWLPGHGIDGNKTADHLARQSSPFPLTGLFIDLKYEFCSTRLTVYSFSTSLKFSHAYIEYTNDFQARNRINRLVLNMARNGFSEINLLLIYAWMQFWCVCVIPKHELCHTFEGFGP
jgi:hypothetical protein